VVSVVILLDNDRLVMTSAIPIPISIVITIAITITVTMNFAYRHATTSYTDSEFLRAGGNCATKTHRDGHCYCVSNHYVLLRI
jgi:hypothetical protein